MFLLIKERSTLFVIGALLALMVALNEAAFKLPFPLARIEGMDQLLDLAIIKL